MAIPHARPGEVIDVRPLGPGLTNAQTHTLIKTDTLEVIRIVMAAGKTLPSHAVAGEITVQCLEGRVEFYIDETKRELTAGSMLYLPGSSTHRLHALEDSSVLVTILL
ncbi:MAG: cupin domain-containing protein [Pirellulales bacterium]|nr:cupin domain-containing protein [Pirellulales bacterium]